VRAAHVRATSKRRRHRLRAVPIERHHPSEASSLHEPARASRSRLTEVLVRMLRSVATRTDAD